MCTLSFYPKKSPKGDFILTFSRDEQPNRSSVEVIKDTKRGLIYPKDVLHGGSWLAMSERTGRVTCLLNGAFERHERQLPYRKSRGLVLLESFDYVQPLDFCKKNDFEGIEPFTMLILENQQFLEFRWDGTQRHIRPLDITKPQLWSSATLYDPSVKRRRESWFQDFLRKNKKFINSESLWQFHQTECIDAPQQGILMRHPAGVRTVSITQLTILSNLQVIKFQYNELGNKNSQLHEFAFGQARTNA